MHTHASPDGFSSLKRPVFKLFAVLIAANIAVWAFALIAFKDNTVLLGTALLAYSFGLRHAFDADHIAAIDNVTRRLMQKGQRPIAVGLFFSLGHSTIVVVLSLAIIATTVLIADRLGEFSAIGGVIGTSVSAAFLIIIGLANLQILILVAKAFRNVRDGGQLVAADVDELLDKRGFFGRIFRRLFGVIGKSWHMYPLGVLFGLGFDTATEIGLLAISATQAAHGMPVWQILVFPALFTAGMSLMDTAGSTFMTGAYGWAFVKPVRKLYYNMTITFISVVVALLIGGVEALGLIGDKLALKGPFWDFVASVGDQFGFVGYAIVGVFVVSWGVSWAIYHLRGYDRIDARSV